MVQTTKSMSDILRLKKIHLMKENLSKNLKNISDSSKKTRTFTYEELVLLKYPKN